MEVRIQLEVGDETWTVSAPAEAVQAYLASLEA